MILFRRIRGRSAGHVVAINPLLVRELQPTVWGGTEVVYTDLHVTVSRDNPLVVQQLLEGRVKLCQTPLCDHDTVDPYTPVCARCRDKGAKTGNNSPARRKLSEDFGNNAAEHGLVPDLVVVNGRHGFQ